MEVAGHQYVLLANRLHDREFYWPCDLAQLRVSWFSARDSRAGSRIALQVAGSFDAGKCLKA
jgi:hypothetical protein